MLEIRVEGGGGRNGLKSRVKQPLLILDPAMFREKFTNASTEQFSNLKFITDWQV